MNQHPSVVASHLTPPPLKLLVVRAQAGDGAAFADLMRRYQTMVWAYAYARSDDQHLAEDVAQETFIDAYRKVRTLRTPEAFPGWLRTIARTRLDHTLRARGT